MNTLLLSRTCQPEAEQLAGIGHSNDWNVGWLGDPQSAPKTINIGNPAIYAETHVALSFAASNNLVLIEPSLDLLTRLPSDLTKRRIEYMPLRDAKKLTTRSFVKPADCVNKSFDPAVCETGEYLRVSSKVSDDTNVLVSEPVLFDIEYRTIILNRELLTFSPYIRSGRLARNENNKWPANDCEIETMSTLVDQLLSNSSVDLPPVFTLDVGMIENVGWAVIEFNPVWCSGFLGCDLSKILSALDMACWHVTDLPRQYSHWIVQRPAMA